MAKGKRYANKEKSTNKKIFKYLIVFFLVLIIVLLLYFFVPRNDSSKLTNSEKETISSNVKKENIDETDEIVRKEEITSSEINEEKHIDGLEDIKIINIDVKSSKSLSIITISLKNDSVQVVNSCKLYLSLFDKDNKYIYATSLKMPNIDANSEISFSIACSKKIENVGNYTIELDSKQK